MRKKKVCIVTGSRAEWGLFYPLARCIKLKKKNLMLQIIATGAHLSASFGMTYREIERDGFKISRKVKLPLKGDADKAIVESAGVGIIRLSSALKALNPDIVILLGDRFETLSAAVSCYLLKIPIAHISGGEVTEGSLDDGIRHAITKLAYLHFASTDIYRKRIIQMGEDPRRVFNVGALALDNIYNTRFLTKGDFEKRIGFKMGKRNIVATFNPSTCENRSLQRINTLNLLRALDRIPDTYIIFTKPNPDIYSDTISSLIEGYVRKNSRRSVFIKSMGRFLYLNALKFADLVAGNSSSGLTEAPSFHIPTVNIGNRQDGRVRAASVIDADADSVSISNAIKKALSVNFRKTCKKVTNPYGDGKSADRVLNIIKKTDIIPKGKRFCDIKFHFSDIKKERSCK